MSKKVWLYLLGLAVGCLVLLELALVFGNLVLSSSHLTWEKVELEVRDCEGGMTRIYLKTNQDVAVISESPEMTPEALYDKECTTRSDQPYFLYMNSTDTLFLVWFSTDPSYMPSLNTKANIKYIWAGDSRYETEDKYTAEGYTKFPSGRQSRDRL